MPDQDDSYDLAPEDPELRRPPPEPPAREIKFDRLCPACGYNLRGLPSKKHRCPECGASIQEGIADDVLAYADPAWVRKLAWGALFTLISFAVPVTLLMVSMVQIIRPAWSIDPNAMAIVGVVVYFAFFVLPSFAGAWLLSTPEPHKVVRTVGDRLASGLRLAACIALGAELTSTALAMLPVADAIEVLVTVVDIAASLGLLAKTLLLGSLLSNLAKRIPDDTLANRTWNLTGLLALNLLVLATVVVLARTWGLSFLCCGVLPAGALFIFGVIASFLLFQYTRDFFACARDAEKTAERRAARGSDQ